MRERVAPSAWRTAISWTRFTAPRQQQNRDVRASDQEEQRGSREERGENRDVRCASLLVDEQAQPNTEVARKSDLTAPGELLEQRLQLRLGDGNRGPSSSRAPAPATSRGCRRSAAAAG